jgi:hypothetical protein
MYNLIGLVVRALSCKAEVQSSNLTRNCKNILVAWEELTLHWSKYLLTHTPSTPLAVAVEISRLSCRNLKSKKTEGGKYCQ